MLKEYKMKLEKQWFAWALCMIMTRLGDNSFLDKLGAAVVSFVFITNVVRYYRLSMRKNNNKISNYE